MINKPTSPSNAAKLRRAPKQDRSRERVEEILRVAKRMVGEKGIDAVKMREIAAETGGPIASLYQYFPNKSAILAMLYEGFIAQMEAEMLALLSRVRTKNDLFDVAFTMLDIYYATVSSDPATIDIIIAIQADKTLLNADIAASRRFATHFASTAKPFVRPDLHAPLERVCFLVFHLVHAAVRLTLSHEPDMRPLILTDFKSLIASQLAVLTSSTP